MSPLEILLAREINNKPVCQQDLVRAFPEIKAATVQGAVMSLLRRGYAFRKRREKFLGYAMDLYLTKAGQQALDLFKGREFSAGQAAEVPARRKRFKSAWERMDYILLEVAFKERTLDQLSQELGISSQRVSQIRISGLARYRATMTMTPQMLTACMRAYKNQNESSQNPDTLEGFHYQELYGKYSRTHEVSPGRFC